MLLIAYDRENSTEMNPKYYVYENDLPIYTGSYTQCLVVVGAISMDNTITLEEVNSKCNGYLFDRVSK